MVAVRRNAISRLMRSAGFPVAGPGRDGLVLEQAHDTRVDAELPDEWADEVAAVLAEGGYRAIVRRTSSGLAGLTVRRP